MGVTSLLLLSVVSAVLAVPGPEVATLQGTVRGSYQQSANGNTYAAFQGIPYAKPPVGKHRFKEPVPAEPWLGVWNAENLPSPCLQYGVTGAIFGVEDCLYLNVYTPKSADNLDVVVKIHGGAFMQGSGADNGPKYLLDRDVVVVNINYRLGPFGFFSTGDDVVPGNNGLKDQVVALRWIQKNIAAFGGNPDRVTLVGTSAGGASVHFHYLSPLSRGLFHQGISLSGTALNCWAQTEGLKQRGAQMAERLGCPTSSVSDMVDCLRHRPAHSIVQQLSNFKAWQIVPYAPFGPTIEVERPGAFLSEQPIKILVEGRSLSLPWITSITSEEGLYPAAGFVASAEYMHDFRERWDEIAHYLLDYVDTLESGQRRAVADRVKKFYLDDKEFSLDTKDQIIQMLGDRMFNADAQRAAQLQAQHTSAQVYFYKFAYRGKNSLSDLFSQTKQNLGVSHADDTAYVFNAFYSATDETDTDIAMSRLMVEMFVNFVHTSNPSPGNVSWQPVQPGQTELKYLHIASPTQVAMRTVRDIGNRHFWDSLPIREPQINHDQAARAADEL